MITYETNCCSKFNMNKIQILGTKITDFVFSVFENFNMSNLIIYWENNRSTNCYLLTLNINAKKSKPWVQFL